MLACRKATDDGSLKANPLHLSRHSAAQAFLKVSALVLLAFCAVGGTQALASEAPRRFEIRSAFAAPAESVYMLNARLGFTLPEGARAAIRDGVALTLDLEIEVNRARRFWLDETVATLEQHYELVYHALSERFLVRNVNSGEQTSWPTLEDAVESLQLVDRLPILDQSLVLPDFRYEVSLRGRLDVRNLPEALRIVLFWVDDWRQQTDWYTWPLNL
jgi:hypothetical protein